MEKTAAELRAMGVDIQSDEEWQQEQDARDAERAQIRRDREAEREVAAAAYAATKAKLDAIADGDTDAWLALLDDISETEEPKPTIPVGGSEPGCPSPARDWVAEAIDSAAPGPGSLPYHAYRANRNLHEVIHLMRDVSRRNMYLSWEVPPQSGMGNVGITSKTSIDNNYSSNKEYKEEEGKKRIFFPTYFPATPSAARTIEFPELVLPKLPRWKDLGSTDKQPVAVQELLLGLRIASLATGGNPTLPGWLSDTPEDDVGFLSIELHGDAAIRFLRGEKGSAATGLSRGLLRSLESFTGGVAAAALWTEGADRPGIVTLYMAMRTRDSRNAGEALELDIASRHVRDLEAHGVEVWNGKTKPSELAAYYGVSEDNIVACDPRNPFAAQLSDFIDIPDGGDVREYSPKTGFASADEVERRHARAWNSWFRKVHAHGLPSWFTGAFIEQVRDYLLRDPEHSKKRTYTVGRMKKMNRKASDRLEMKRLDAMELPLTNLRFYKGSPAQFAALAARSGKVLGSYYDKRHKAGAAKELYEQIRAEGTK